MVPLVRDLEQLLLPALNKAGDEIAGEFPLVKVQVFSGRLEPDGRQWAISCLVIFLIFSPRSLVRQAKPG
jgi:hypothetical protein